MKIESATSKEPKQAKDVSKQIYQNLKQKQDEKLIPNLDIFNKSFNEIFK